MDQSKTFIPHSARQSKQTSQMANIKTHLTGVLVHGVQDAWGFLDCDQWPHASNLTIRPPFFITCFTGENFLKSCRDSEKK